MNTTKKLLVIALVAVLAAVSFVPSTFSWYTHNTASDGKKINYNRSDLPVSAKTASGSITMSTVLSDEFGEKTSTSVTGINNLAAGSMNYYITTLTNDGDNDVMVDLQMKNLINNADFVIGTISPTLNEKAYASRAVRNKVSYTKTRVYFKTNSSYSSFWAEDNGRLLRETGTYMPDGTTPGSTGAAGSAAQTSGSTGSTNDINIEKLRQFIGNQAQIESVAEGKFVVPNLWLSRFDIGKCSNRKNRDNYGMSILAKASLEKNNNIFSDITLEETDGQISSFKIRNKLGENFLIIGLPNELFGIKSPKSETVIFMVPRLVRTLKTNEKIKNKL